MGNFYQVRSYFRDRSKSKVVEKIFPKREKRALMDQDQKKDLGRSPGLFLRACIRSGDLVCIHGFLFARIFARRFRFAFWRIGLDTEETRSAFLESCNLSGFRIVFLLLRIHPFLRRGNVRRNRTPVHFI